MSERVAGTDTREAMATPTVRAAAAAAAFIAGPGWIAAFRMPAAWKRYLSMPSGLAPWVALFLTFAAIATAIVAWRVGPLRIGPVDRRTKQLPSGVAPVLILVAFAVFAIAKRDTGVGALLLLFVPLVAGWFTGQVARIAVRTCVPDVASAAAGVITAGALMGLLIAGHIALVARGSGMLRAEGWSVAYWLLAIANLAHALRALPRDLVKVSRRVDAMPIENARAEPPVLVMDRISVSFGVNHVLRDTSVVVYAGELVALVGGNGAGKSTLLRVAAGAIAPDHGRVVVGDDEVTTLLPEERSAAGLAFVSGARPTFPDLTVIENLRVAAYKSHLTARSFERATEAIFEMVPMLSRRPKARAGVLSGGEQRLLAVAQTLYRRPRALLADELTLGLDVEARIAVLDLLRILADEGVACIVVDHDLPSLLPRSDRAVLLSQGEVEHYDEPEELLTKRADLLPATFLAGANG